MDIMLACRTEHCRGRETRALPDDGFAGKDQFIKPLAAQSFRKCPEACFVLFRASFRKCFPVLTQPESFQLLFRVLAKRQRLSPPLRLYQHNRTRLAHPERRNDETACPVQVLEVIQQTDASRHLCQQTGSVLTGNTINGKRLFLPNQGIDSCQITYFFVNHLLL